MEEGAVSSPLLWNFFTTALDENAFADDFHALATSSSIDDLTDGLNAAAGGMGLWDVHLSPKIHRYPFYSVD